MKKILIVLLAVLCVFAAVSCEQEPVIDSLFDEETRAKFDYWMSLEEFDFENMTTDLSVALEIFDDIEEQKCTSAIFTLDVDMGPGFYETYHSETTLTDGLKGIITLSFSSETSCSMTFEGAFEGHRFEKTDKIYVTVSDMELDDIDEISTVKLNSTETDSLLNCLRILAEQTEDYYVPFENGSLSIQIKRQYELYELVDPITTASDFSETYEKRVDSSGAVWTTLLEAHVIAENPESVFELKEEIFANENPGLGLSAGTFIISVNGTDYRSILI